MDIEKILTKEEVFKFIATSSIYGNLGLFVGTGLPMAILNNETKTIALSWKTLIEKCSFQLEIDTTILKTEGASYPISHRRFAESIQTIWDYLLRIQYEN